MNDDLLRIGEFEFKSRLFTGTGLYPDTATMRGALEASACEMVTVAIRRVDLSDRSSESIASTLIEGGYTILPNTAGCYTVEEAIRTANLARELLDTPLIKLEVIGCQRTLFPDVEETVKAAQILVKEGFTVLPYTTDDPVIARRLEDAGCAAIMPLAAPIGSGLGIRNPYNLAIILEQSSIPVIVDAGVGTASDAALAMELGCSGVIMNTAIALADDPVRMAVAMKWAVQAGRQAYLAGRMPKRLHASASSPIEGMLG